jgi:hypothetical protein
MLHVIAKKKKLNIHKTRLDSVQNVSLQKSNSAQRKAIMEEVKGKIIRYAENKQ